MKKILIVKTSSLGDIIQAFPVLDYLKERYPNASIDWAAEQSFAELLQAHPFISSVLTIQTKKWRKKLFHPSTFNEIRLFKKSLKEKEYDLVIDLQGNIKSGLVTFAARSSFKAGFGWKTVPEKPNLLFTNKHFNPPPCGNIRDDYLFIAQSATGDFSFPKPATALLKIHSGLKDKINQIIQSGALQSGVKVVFCPGSNWPNKQLEFSESKDFLSMLAAKLQAKFLFVWGTSEEKAYVDKLHFFFHSNSVVVERLSLAGLQHLMSASDLVIAVDSLPLHLAATTSVPTFSLFGPSLAAKYKPIGSRHFAFQGACPYGKQFEKRCPLLRKCSTGACMKEMSVDQLFNAFDKWWNEIRS